ncbi:hypothetical protein Taro_038805 [Colocasia esculenta]|uniref:LOB domain-containing protein n=1 Tax=Colocasia esculenta TaxID=4460 RepID=A0A843W7N8_COLES|nr:hypothetical protein [Colocasia esculenta]
MSSTSSRCAACKYLRRRCSEDCVLAPYFPSTHPDRFACVHKIFGASNVTRMLQQIPVQQRALAADTISYEAYWRVRDPVYGCVGVISLLQQEIQTSERELAKTQALLAMHAAAEGGGPRGELAAERASASTAVARYQLQGLHAWDPQDCTLLAADPDCQIPPSLPPSSYS